MSQKIKDFGHLLIATTNQGKVKELTNLLAGYNIKIFSLNDFRIVPPIEDGETFLANAELKARYYGMKTNLITLADDSGFSIQALNHQPGVHSARFAEELGGYEQTFTWFARKNLHQSPAYYTCVLSLWFPEDQVDSFEGTINGHISLPAKGSNGFGYDPIFVPSDHHQTFAELTQEYKNLISHRAIAMKKLIKAQFTE